MAFLLKDVWHSTVIDFGCLRSRILWTKFNFSRVKVVVVGYDYIEGGGEEREKFWNDADRILYTVGNGYRLYVVRDLNGWVGDKVKMRITGAFGIPRENDNGRRVVESCVGTYFAQNSLHKYTKVARVQDGGGSKINDRYNVSKERYAVLWAG